jgi:PKD repeat protein
MAPLAVTFTDTSTGSITNRFWNFGDGGTTNTTATSISHTYTVAGTSTVQLVVSGLGGVSTNTQANLISVAAAPAGSLYLYDGFDYTADTRLTSSSGTNGWYGGGSQPSPTNRAGSLTYTGLPTSIGGKMELAGYRPISGGTLILKTWSMQPNQTTNLFASFLLNVASIGTSVSNINANLFAMRVTKAGLCLSNNAANPGNFNIGVMANGPNQPVTAWADNGGTGYLPSTTYFVVFSYTNNPTTGYGDQVWVNPVLGQATPGAAQVTVAGLYLNNPSNSIAFANGNGVTDPNQRAQIYIDEFRIGSTWASVTPSMISAPAPVITSVLTATGTVNQAFSYQITADNSPSSFNASGLPAGLSVNTNSGAITGTPTTAGSNNVTISASSSGGTDSKTLVVVISSAAGGTDTDSDGIPDEWENQHFGGSTNANPHALAANGVNTILEAYVAGLNPTNAQSVFSISNQQLASQRVLEWNAVSGRVCSVYWTTNLLNGFQSLETNLVWPQSSWTDTVHGAQGGGYYRIKVRMGQ